MTDTDKQPDYLGHRQRLRSRFLSNEGRDMADYELLELVLTMLAEATTTEISKTVKPATFSENQKVAQKGGSIAGNTRKEIEETTGKPVITAQNAND